MFENRPNNSQSTDNHKKMIEGISPSPINLYNSPQQNQQVFLSQTNNYNIFYREDVEKKGGENSGKKTKNNYNSNYNQDSIFSYFNGGKKDSVREQESHHSLHADYMSVDQLK